MEKINEITIPEGVESISVTQHDDKIVIKLIPKWDKFKNGDFVYEDGRIMIVKSYPNMYHADIYPEHSNIVCYNDWYGVDFSSPTFRHATAEEKQLLINEMKKDGKRWNSDKKCIEDIPKRKFKAGDKVKIKDGISSKTHRRVGPHFTELMDEFIGKELTVYDYTERGNVRCDNAFHFAEDWLEPWSDELKKGDLAIFWDNGYSYPLIRPYGTKADDWRGHYDNIGSAWDNAIKWDGTKEQFEKVLRGEI